MIVFDLRCGAGHVFEEWFASTADYEAQATASAIRCPECGDAYVEKTITAPRVNDGVREPAGPPCGLPQCAQGICAFDGARQSRE